MSKLIKFLHEENTRWGLQIDDKTYPLAKTFSLASWLQASNGRVDEAIGELISSAQSNAPIEGDISLLAPVDNQEIWAAGVTYERSRSARQEESEDGGDVYARVYDAERPELFFKSLAYKVVPPLGDVGIREDTTWNVPEPELTLVFNPNMEHIGFTIGNDMSSRDIEGENPLYLPQAKVYKNACAVGPAILLQPSDKWLDTLIQIKIERDGEVMFDDGVHTDKIKRKLPELQDFLGRSQEFAYGVMLMTGTGTVPPSEFTLQAGDVIHITIDAIGTLTNTVVVV